MEDSNQKIMIQINKIKLPKSYRNISVIPRNNYQSNI